MRIHKLSNKFSRCKCKDKSCINNTYTKEIMQNGVFLIILNHFNYHFISLIAGMFKVL